MKKIYINPSIEVIKIETHNFIAGSVDIVNETPVAAESAESRQGRGFFGDDE